MKLTKEKIKSVRQRSIESENMKIKALTDALKWLPEDQELKDDLKECEMNKTKFIEATDSEIEEIFNQVVAKYNK